MKKPLFLVTALLGVFLLAAPAMAAPAIVIDGCQLTSDLAPVVQGDQVYLPLRSVATALGTTVAWDPATQTATVSKNGTVLTVDRPDLSMQLDGQALPGSALVTGGQILVPAQVLEKALGARVTLDSVSGNVYIDYQETVDGLTPEQLLVKSGEAAKTSGTYKFTARLDVSTSAQGQPAVTLPMQIQGQVQEPGLAYTLSTMSMGGKEIKSESYVDDGKMYMNVNGAGWKEVPVSSSLSNMQQEFGNDPAANVDMIGAMGGIISAMTPQTVDGATCDVVRVTVDPVRFKTWLTKMMGAVTSSGDNQAQVQKLLQDMLGVMRIKNLAFEIFIDPQTYLLRQEYLTMEMSVDMPPAPMTLTEHGAFRMYGFGQPVQMPQVPAGQ